MAGRAGPREGARLPGHGGTRVPGIVTLRLWKPPPWGLPPRTPHLGPSSPTPRGSRGVSAKALCTSVRLPMVPDASPGSGSHLSFGENSFPPHRGTRRVPGLVRGTGPGPSQSHRPVPFLPAPRSHSPPSSNQAPPVSIVTLRVPPPPLERECAGTRAGVPGCLVHGGTPAPRTAPRQEGALLYPPRSISSRSRGLEPVKYPAW